MRKGRDIVSRKHIRPCTQQLPEFDKTGSQFFKRLCQTFGMVVLLLVTSEQGCIVIFLFVAVAQQKFGDEMV
jgi:hypothetical protein